MATGIAIVNTIGSSGGLVGPKVFGLMREQTHGFQAPVLAMAALLAAGGIVGDHDQAEGRVEVRGLLGRRLQLLTTEARTHR